MNFKLQNYEMVEDRLKRFWEKCPDGRIDTEVINVLMDGAMIMVKAYLYAHRDDKHPTATGIAMDWKGKDSGANRTNWCENSETSAIGRAIANSPYQSKKAPRPSREEMEIALGRRNNTQANTPAKAEKKEVAKSIKEEVALPEPKETKVDQAVDSEMAKKKEIFEMVKEFSVEYEKMMIEKNPDIDAEKDFRMKFPTAVISNMEKCLSTLGYKRYEQKWEQWKKIHNNFQPKKLEPREESVASDEARKIMEDGGIDLMEMNMVNPEDLPPLDEDFNAFPPINKNATYKGRSPESVVSSKQIETMQKCLKFRKLNEAKAVRWINSIYEQNYQHLGDLTKEEASQVIGAFFSQSKR